MVWRIWRKNLGGRGEEEDGEHFRWREQQELTKTEEGRRELKAFRELN